LENLEMKKTLVAIAALAATGAFAQSSVTLYGNMDQSVFGAKQSDGKQVLSSNSNGGSTSLWGITGSEDLGGGTKAEFDLKSEITLATGATSSSGSTATKTADNSNAQATTFNRGAWVGLSDAKYGNVKIGRQNDALWEQAGKFNNTGINSFGWNNLTAAATGFSTTAASNTFNAKAVGDATNNGLGNNLSTTTTGASANNPSASGTGLAFTAGVSYETPKIAGFSAKYAASTPKTQYNDLSSEGARKQLALAYANGPLTAAVAQSTLNSGNGETGAKVTLVGAAYTMGAFKFTAAQQNTKFSGEWAAANDLTVQGLGVAYTQGKMEYNLGYTVLKDKEDSTYKTTQTGVTARYNLSKRTSVYAGYGNGKNEGASNKTNIVYAGSGLTAAGNSSAYLVGLKHSF
jgi:predicted porin